MMRMPQELEEALNRLANEAYLERVQNSKADKLKWLQRTKQFSKKKLLKGE